MKRQLGLLVVLVVVALVAAALPALQSWAACTTTTCTPAHVDEGGLCEPDRVTGGGCNIPEIQSSNTCQPKTVTFSLSQNSNTKECTYDARTGELTCWYICHLRGHADKDATSCDYTGACPE